jgi:hypothetical protein
MSMACKISYNANELKYINYCHLFLNFISIADRTDEYGEYIIHEMYKIKFDSFKSYDQHAPKGQPNQIKYNKNRKPIEIPNMFNTKI